MTSDSRTPQAPLQQRLLSGGGDRGARMRALDWSRTVLGAVEDWPPALRTALSLMLASPEPTAFFWAPARVLLCNDGFTPLLVDGPPDAPEPRGLFVHAGAWLDARIDEVLRTGTAVRSPHVHTPVRDEHGDVVGVLTTASALEAVQARAEHAHLLQEVEAANGRLSRLIENAPAFMCTLRGPRHAYELVNPLYQQLVGQGRPLVGLTFQEALPDTVEGGFIGILDEVYRTGVPFVGREMPLFADRQGRGPEGCFIHFVFQPRRDGHGDVEGIDVFGFEVTGQVHARRRLEELAQRLADSEERLRLVLESSGMGLWELDSTGRVEMDMRMVTLMGQEPGVAFEQATLLARFFPEDRERVRGAVAAALAGEHGGRFHETFRALSGLDGAPRWVEAFGHRLPGTDGRSVALAGILVDITARKQVEAAREAAERELRTRARFEQQLIGIVSHDLRNPLSAILLWAMMLARQEGLDARATRAVTNIQLSAERASRMVKDLLDFTQARLGGGIRIERLPADLHEVTREVVAEVEAAHPGRTLVLRHEGEGREALDADRLAQVVQNLVTNALKYSPEDSRVDVATQADAEALVLTVHNGGAPIAGDKLASLFEPLQRATDEVDRTGRSVGLGLYIVKSIVEAHGGTIRVCSTQEGGTTFTVRLPRLPG